MLQLQPDDTDHTHGGILRFTPEFIGELLRLPPGQKAIAAKIGLDGTIELLIDGAGLPLKGTDGASYVTIVCEQQERGLAAKQRRIVAHWAHSPNEKWILRDWTAA